MKLCPTCKGQYGGGEVFCPVDATRLLTASQMDSTGAVDPNDPLIGMVLAGRYKVLERIGEGGMGLVYSGLHSLIDKRVAIKVLRDDFSSRPDVVARFRQEAKSASRIGHEHIVDIFDFGETPWGASYFVMEYLEGEDLANVLHRETVVSPGRTIELARQCCRALGAAHSKGIVHRDMKPENIYLVRRDDHSEFVKIVDFGIAKMSDIETDGAPGRKLTKTGMIFGTPEYMSPEQAAGKALDHRVDVYAMGVILYECPSSATLSWACSPNTCSSRRRRFARRTRTSTARTRSSGSSTRPCRKTRTTAISAWTTSTGRSSWRPRARSASTRCTGTARRSRPRA